MGYELDFRRLGRRLNELRGGEPMASFGGGVLSGGHQSKLERGQVSDVNLSTLLKVSEVYSISLLEVMELVVGPFSADEVAGLVERKSPEERDQLIRRLGLMKVVGVEASLEPSTRRVLDEMRDDGKETLDLLRKLFYDLQARAEVDDGLPVSLRGELETKTG